MIYIISFIFGMIFGSFISVLVWRIKNNEKGIFLGRSKCPKCNHTLSSLDLVPIFSYIFLKGKCRYCSDKISIIYPILEFVTGLTFVFITYFLVSIYGLENVINYYWILIYAWIIGVFIIAISFYDILFYEISFILSSILAGLVLFPQFFGIIGDWKLALVLAFFGFVVFIGIIYLRDKIRKIEGMGGGDAIGAALIGLFMPIIVQLLGWEFYPIGLSFYITILLGFILAGFVGLFFVLIGKGSKFAIPFLPFMFIGLILFILFGKYLLDYVV